MKSKKSRFDWRDKGSFAIPDDSEKGTRVHGCLDSGGGPEGFRRQSSCHVILYDTVWQVPAQGTDHLIRTTIFHEENG
jgi:hypothetical protein